MTTTQHVDGSSAADQTTRHKKNSIGSWFSKKFGRRASEAASSGAPYDAAGWNAYDGTHGAKKAGKAKDGRGRRATRSDANPATLHEDAAQQAHFTPAFESGSAQGLANTLVVPGSTNGGRLTPPPQLGGIIAQEPIGSIDLPQNMDSPSARQPLSSELSSHAVSPQDNGGLSPTTASEAKLTEPPTPRPVSDARLNPVTGSADTALVHTSIPTSDAVGSDVRSNRLCASSSDDSRSSRDGRDSIGNRTMDTGKSRASTKPTTLMSLETRDPIVLPTAHIAQVRHTDESLGISPRLGASGPRDSSGGGSSIHFVPANASRTASGNLGAGQTVESTGPYVSVPSHSRPHPINNPHPSGIPADNASVLTLASSTAGMSLGGGGAPSSRGHHHAPSLGGARSIGGSLMGDRRNSSDTYASLKALPPLSRRGSDSSSRTRESVAASATGQNSHQAMFVPGSYGGPGAPSDRVSLHRTPSQRTVATQMSVPLSASTSNPALNAYAKSGEAGVYANGAHADSDSMIATAAASPSVTAEPFTEPAAAAGGDNAVQSGADIAQAPANPSAALLESHAEHLASTEHDEALAKVAAVTSTEPAASQSAVDPTPTLETAGRLEVPGGPPVA